MLEWVIDQGRGIAYHKVGGYVVLARNLRNVPEVVRSKVSGLMVKIETPVPTGKPYISFSYERESNGERYLDEDCSVSGGIEAYEAERVIAELKQAVKLIAEFKE